MPSKYDFDPQNPPQWVQTYLDWFLQVPYLREPISSKEFCAEHLINHRDLSKLENCAPWIELMALHTRKAGFTNGQIAAVKDALLANAMLPQGSKDREVLLRMTGEYVPTDKRELSGAVVDHSKTSTEDLFDALARSLGSAAPVAGGQSPNPLPAGDGFGGSAPAHHLPAAPAAPTPATKE